MSKVQKVLEKLEYGEIDSVLAESMISDIVTKVKTIQTMKLIKELFSIIATMAFAAIGIWFCIRLIF